MLYDILIIGGGPAGLTAATYARRAGKSVLVIEKNAFGGQITWSPRVENFPGFLSLSGTELGDKLLEQAMEQGAEVELDTAGYAASGEDCLTKSAGVFVAGDCRAKGVRQLTTAAADGSVAALAACRYLDA